MTPFFDRKRYPVRLQGCACARTSQVVTHSAAEEAGGAVGEVQGMGK